MFDKVLFIVGSSLTGAAYLVGGVPGAIMAIVGGAILTQTNPTALSKITAKVARKIARKTSTQEFPEITP